MASLHVRGHLKNDTVYPDYDIANNQLVDAFIGDDTGAPLQSVWFELVTDDGYRVEFGGGPTKTDRLIARVAKIE